VNSRSSAARRADATVDELLSLYRERGSTSYFGESVSLTEHALQAAHFARAAGAGDALVVAALLHDVGHLLEEVPSDLAEWTHDAEHERVGADWLARRLPPSVAEPVRLHVRAKRYLLAAEPAYLARLSPASVATLKLQGGPLSVAEVRDFTAAPYHAEAVLVRRCDDRAKQPGLAVPPLEDYLGLLRSMASSAPVP
jgi:gamma-butyrobetaine dioxygenase